MGHVSDADPHRESFDARVARLAARQHGVFSREQLACFGGTKGVMARRVHAGRWETMATGVFRLAGSPTSWRQSLLVACLAWGEGAVGSHLAAPPLFDLPGLPPGTIEVTVPRNRSRKGPGIVHRRDLPPVDVTAVGAIPVTTVARTLIDIAPLVPEETLEVAFDDALRRGLVSLRRLQWRVEELASPGRPGIGVMRALLEKRDRSVPHSVLETRFLRLLRAARLPRPVTQHVIRDRGRPVARVDFRVPSGAPRDRDRRLRLSLGSPALAARSRETQRDHPPRLARDPRHVG